MPSSEARRAAVIGARVYEARKAARLTRKQLAEPDLTVEYVRMVEKGEIVPKWGHLFAWAQKLGKPVSWFLHDLPLGVMTDYSLIPFNVLGTVYEDDEYTKEPVFDIDDELDIIENLLYLIEAPDDQISAILDLERQRMQITQSIIESSKSLGRIWARITRPSPN